MLKELSLCSAEYSINNNKPLVRLICRDENFKRVIVHVPGFKPYFYIASEYADYLKGEDVEITPTSRIALLGMRLKKVESNQIPSHIAELREKCKRMGVDPKYIYEADIPYAQLFLLDNNIKTGIIADLDEKSYARRVIPKECPSRFKIAYLDIEVLTPHMRKQIDAVYPIAVIGIHIDGVYYILYQGKKLEIDCKEALEDKSAEVRLLNCLNEEELLKAFVRLIKAKEPDIIATFTDFDIKYLLNRLVVLNIHKRDLSPIGIVSIKPDKVKISGIQIMDLALLYRKIFGTPKWESLESIARNELGYGRIFHKENVSQLWSSGEREKVMLRNLRDVELIYELDKKLLLIDFFDNIRRIVGCNLSDTPISSRVADYLYLRYVKHNTDYALPIRRAVKKVDYKGALVFDPLPGIYENVLLMDWSEMYPSIMEAFNISYETLTEDESGDINLDNLYFFTSEPVGWAVAILRELRPLRWELKKMLKNPNLSPEEVRRIKSKSDALKHIINAIYGCFSYAGSFANEVSPASRLYRPTVAEAITYCGRALQEGVKKACNELNYTILYGDTDSTMVQLKTSNLEEEAKMIVEQINVKVMDYIYERFKRKVNLSLSIDKIFKKLILYPVKKRYKGITLDGSIVTKGIEQVRSDQADITAELLDRVSGLILSGASREEVIRAVRKAISEFRNLPLTKIAIPKRLTKDIGSYKSFSQHLGAFLSARSPIELGDRFYLVPLKRPLSKVKWTKREDIGGIVWSKTESKDVKAIAFTEDLDEDLKRLIDFDKLFEVTVKNKLENLLSLMGIDWERDIEGKASYTLERWSV